MGRYYVVVLLAMVMASATVQGRTLVVDQKHPQAADDNPGTAQWPFKTIAPAAVLAQPGDTVEIAAGVYREHVSPVIGGSAPDKMITYRSRPGDYVVLKGSDVATFDWERAQLEGVSVGIWQAQLKEDMFSYDFPVENFNPFVLSMSPISEDQAQISSSRPLEPDKPLSPTRGALFLDGEPLRQIVNPAQFNWTTGVFLVSHDGKSIIARLPEDREPHGVEFEVVTREQVFAPREMGLSFVRVQGLNFEHAATGGVWPQVAMVSPAGYAWSNFWIFEDCTFRWANTGGLDVGQGAWFPLPGRKRANSPSSGSLDFRMIVRRCKFLDNGSAGLWCYSHGGSLLVEDCIFERNNSGSFLTWEEAGIKCHSIENSVFRNNLFRDNDSYALWLDVGGRNNRITQNLFINNMNCGVFIEGFAGTTLIDNNIVIGSRSFTHYQMTKADGFYSHQTSNLVMVHNLAFGNAGYGFRCVLHSPQKINGWPDDKTSKVAHCRVLNNISYGNARGAVSLPVDQEHCWDNVSEDNFFWGQADPPLFVLERGIAAPATLVALVEEALADGQISPHEAPLLNRWKDGRMGPAVGDMRHNGPMVTLPLWQAIFGRDKNSIVGPLPDFRMYREGRMFIDTKRPAAPRGAIAVAGTGEKIGALPENYADLAAVKCERLGYIKYDYFGRVRPENEPPTVGPIQGLDKIAGNGAVTIELWPNGSPTRPPARELKINMKPLSVVREKAEEESN